MTTHIRTINQLSTPLAEQSFVFLFDHVITFAHVAQQLLSIEDTDMAAHIEAAIVEIPYLAEPRADDFRLFWGGPCNIVRGLTFLIG